MDTSAQEHIEEVILTGDDLMMGPPSPLIPPDLANQVLDSVELCSRNLRKLFECLHNNDIEPFCQDEILMYSRCSQGRDAQLRARVYAAEEDLGRQRVESEVMDRVNQLKSHATLLERRFTLATGIEGMEGFRQRWSLNGQMHDTKLRIESLERGLASQKKVAAPHATEGPSSPKSWFRV